MSCLCMRLHAYLMVSNEYQAGSSLMDNNDNNDNHGTFITGGNDTRDSASGRVIAPHEASRQTNQGAPTATAANGTLPHTNNLLDTPLSKARKTLYASNNSVSFNKHADKIALIKPIGYNSNSNSNNSNNSNNNAVGLSGVPQFPVPGN